MLAPLIYIKPKLLPSFCLRDMSPYAASILFVLPPQAWQYLLRLVPSPRGEIEMQTGVQMMIEDVYKAFGLLQPAPEEWSPELIEKVERS